MTGIVAGQQRAVLAAPALEASHTFPGQPTAVRQARKWMTALLAGFGSADDAVLAFSELATNAVVHSNSGLPGGEFTVRAVICGDVIRIEVIDQGGAWQPPDRLAGPQDTDADDEGWQPDGRGLLIVAGLATVWGLTGDNSCRMAWCEIGVEECPISEPAQDPEKQLRMTGS